MIVGILAFHGDFAEHHQVLQSMKIRSLEVRTVEDLHCVTHLILPGGESTVMSKFLESTGAGKEIQKRVSNGSFAVYGTCAGAILLAKKVTGKHAPRALGLLDITVERNAYGTQAQSFEEEISIKGIRTPLRVAFIRAPKITKVGTNVEVLAKHNGDPILVKQGRMLAGTFHPEVRADEAVHTMFLRM
ncbi:pyridoxal 5'-phosphate synthase glutaminase subunit PdxT [Candidatus Peregrinibacteria bacterium]|nr:pyridoxal 5'-phosphate synthase glutaminase subunit PdxT [Candidatus Peregrinibacteria bacterium]MBI3816531.1 pyridoxal 5'-phosphate synthase glutaminase subunit PdxT [Candidatus Peregrinibacteria bacterium]